MNFCRNCGTRMPDAAPGMGAPQVTPPGASGYRPASAPGAMAPGYPPAAMPGMGAPPQVTPPGAYPPPGVSHGGYPGHGMQPAAPSGYPPGPTAAPSGYPPGPTAAASQSCPHCGGGTPVGYGFCQQCGKKLAPAPAPTGVDAMGPTLAASAVPAEVQRIAGGSAPAPAKAEGLAWGALVSLQRDGSDGERHPLAGEWMELGRDLGDIRFPDDRFLARQHARIERTDAGARIVPLDRLNGVYRRVFDPVKLVDGVQLLLGREVMRFELVDDDERDAAPLVRHGVALFGSPPRAPWGRLLQLLASGGVRDVRYLSSEVVIVGREEGDIVFRDDAFLSRRHASFTFTNGACMLDDLDSSNGTFLRLSGPTVITAGEQLRMGDQVFRFEYLA